MAFHLEMALQSGSKAVFIATYVSFVPAIMPRNVKFLTESAPSTHGCLSTILTMPPARVEHERDRVAVGRHAGRVGDATLGGKDGGHLLEHLERIPAANVVAVGRCRGQLR